MKLTFDETLERINDERSVSYADVRADALRRVIWMRAGAYAWPGGYPLYFITSDGEALSFDTVRAEYAQVSRAIRDKSNDGWRVVACEVNYEDAELTCAHSGNRIDSAYGEE